MYFMEKLTLWLAIIGGINWGLVGFFGFNLVGALFGDMSILTRIVYMLVGLSAVWLAYTQIVPDRVVVVKKS